MFEILQVPEAKLVATGSAKHLKAGAVVGFDPWLHTPSTIEELAKALAAPRASS